MNANETLDIVYINLKITLQEVILTRLSTNDRLKFQGMRNSERRKLSKLEYIISIL